MEQALQAALGFARTAGDTLKAQIMDLAPEPVRAVIAEAPSLIVLLVAVFVGLVLFQLVLSFLFGGRRRRPKAETDSAVERPNRRGVPEAPPTPSPPRDYTPGITAASERGDKAFMIGDLNAAKANYEEAERMARRWMEEDARPESFRALSRSLLRIADVRLKAGDLDAARHATQEALGAVRALVERRPQDVQAQRELAVALERAGGAAFAAQDKAGARRAWEEELAIANRLAGAQGADPSWNRFIAVVHVLVGNLSEPDAMTHYDRALRYFDAAEKAGPLSADDQETRNQLRALLRRG